MIKHRKLIFTVEVAMRDVPIFNDELHTIEEIKDEMYAHLQQSYPQQMLVGGDAKLELLEI
jgi:hypothetical protein